MICVRCYRKLPEGATFCPYCGKRQAQTPGTPAKKRPVRAKGTGSAYKLSGNRRKPWAAARGGQLVGTYATKSEALLALDRVADRELGDCYSYTLEQVYDSWRACIRRPTKMIGQSPPRSRRSAPALPTGRRSPALCWQRPSGSSRSTS